MAKEGDGWMMNGLEWNDPYRIRTWQELVNWINEIGFLPLFQNEIEGFSVEEHVSPLYWWTGNAEQDPWEWREVIAGTGKVAYGKFFERKVGFISKEWFPVFANYRRDGYDFDSRWEDGLANIRHKKIMDCFETDEEVEEAREHTGLQMKREAGFGRDGYKNFDGMITELQMQTYLVVSGFRRKRSKKGHEYGMPVCVYSRPEKLWGYDMVTGAYREEPEDSGEKIFRHIRELYPGASDKMIEKIIR